MTWLEFKNAVKVYLTVDANRLGATAYVDGLIRQGVLDLQNFIQAFQSGFITKFGVNDLDVEAETSVGTMPHGAKIADLYLIRTGHTCCRAPYVPYPGGWDNRFDLTCQNARLGALPLFVLSPWADSFYVYPKIEAGYEVEMTWDGVKIAFADGDTLPAAYEDEQAHLAVAEFVKARVAREVKNDLQFKTSYQADYYGLRQLLYLRWKANTSYVMRRESPDQASNCSGCAGDCETVGAGAGDDNVGSDGSAEQSASQ